MQIAEQKAETIQEYQKSQNIRLLDVFLIGPVMIYGAYKSNMHPALRATLAIFGICTIYYNGKNYLINKNNNQQPKK